MPQRTVSQPTDTETVTLHPKTVYALILIPLITICCLMFLHSRRNPLRAFVISAHHPINICFSR